MGHSRLKEEIGATEWPGWIEFLLSPDKFDFYLAQIAWGIYRLEIRWCGLPRGETAKKFSNFFLNREMPKNKKGEEVEDEEVPEESEEEVRERKKAKIAEMARLRYAGMFGIETPPIPGQS